MAKKEKAILHGGYEQMKDTPWITQGRDIAQRGGEGILENYNRVNVFDEGQRTSMEKLNEDAYRRAFEDLNRGYREGMNKYVSANYNRFGTLNATPASYITDEFNRKYSRDMANLAYNKAINYENLVNQELQRRYNTLNMMQTLYNMGQIPHQLDLANWDIRNKNRDISFEDRQRAYAVEKANEAKKDKMWTDIGSMAGGLIGSIFGPVGAMVGSQIGSAGTGKVMEYI